MHRRDLMLATAGGGLLAVSSLKEAVAQSRSATLLCLVESGPNSLDLHAPGANRATQALVWATFDRLLGFGNTTDPQGHQIYDYSNLTPELAESFQIASDGMSVTFKLRQDAKFHSGNPVMAEDVKWSLDRAVTLPGFPKNQMNSGSLLEPRQFVIVDPHTIRVDFINRDKLLLPNLSNAIPNIFDSKLVKEKATAADPWGVEFTRANNTGGGAFRVASWRPGQETVLERFRDWKGGPQTNVQRVIIREVASAATRRALIERGDADVLQDLPPKDFSELIQARRATVYSTPMKNTWRFLGMNTQRAPFNDKRVRQAVAWAVPYEEIFQAALFGRGRKLWDATGEPTELRWPSPSPYSTNVDRAKALLAEAGLPNGFETTFHMDISQATLHEPIALLLQEGLAKAGIRVTIERVPAGQLRGQLANKALPFFVEDFGAWFDDPDYFFFISYHGSNGPWNSANYVSPEMTGLIDSARTERDGARYETLVRQIFAKAFDDVPFIPLVQPFQDVAVKNGTTGHRYIFHRQLEYRFFQKP